VLSEIPEVTRHLDHATLERLERPEEYLGSADAFRKRLLNPRKDSKSEKE
jgi:hypothetical protein